MPDTNNFTFNDGSKNTIITGSVGTVITDKEREKCPFLNGNRFINVNGSSLEKRDVLTDELYKKIKVNNWVNLYGVGGYGKTSLVYLLAEKHKEDFNSMVRALVNSNVRKDIVNELWHSLRLDDVKEINIDKQYRKVLDVLEDGTANTPVDKINLLIIDINQCLETEIESFVGMMQYASNGKDALCPNGWKVLFVSRQRITNLDESCCLDINKDDETNTEYLSNILAGYVRNKENKEVFLDKNVQNKFLKLIYYSPLLVKIIGFEIKNISKIKSFDDVFKSIEKIKIRHNAKTKLKDFKNQSVEENLKSYIRGLVVYKNMPHIQHLLLSFFMVWPTEPIDICVVLQFIKNYNVSIAIDTDILKDYLDDLVSRGLLTSVDKVYTLHGLLRDSLLSQYIEKWTTEGLELSGFMKKWYRFSDWFWKNREIYNNYYQYIRNCSDIIQYIDYRKEPQTLIACINSSIDFDIAEKEKIDDLSDDHLIKLYREESVLKKQIKEASGNYEVLTLLYYKIAKFYIVKHSDSNSAFSYLKMIREIAEKDTTTIKYIIYYICGLFYLINLDSNITINDLKDFLKIDYISNFGKRKLNFMPAEIVEKLNVYFRENILGQCDFSDSFINSEENWVNLKMMYREKFYDSFCVYKFCCKYVPQNFSNLEDNDCKEVVRHFMLWPDIECSLDVIKSLLPQVHRLEDVLNKLLDSMILLKLNGGYCMPDFVTRHFRSQVFMNDSNAYFRDYSQYFKNIIDLDYIKDYESPIAKCVYATLDNDVFMEEYYWKTLPKNEISDKDLECKYNMVKVEGHDFYICKYAVSQGEWEEMYGKENNPSEFKNGDDYPVEHVSWYDAMLYIMKLNKETGLCFRLPSENEWVWACEYSNADKRNVDDVAWHRGNSGRSTHPVGETPTPISDEEDYGIKNMLGNVWEWCSDWYSKGGSRRVNRGGSWFNGAGNASSSSRDNYYPYFRYSGLGFRLALQFKQ